MTEKQASPEPPSDPFESRAKAQGSPEPPPTAAPGQQNWSDTAKPAYERASVADDPTGKSNA